MRHQDWPTILAEKLHEASNKPFVWGEHDCLLWSADVVHAMTGIDYVGNVRGKYHNKKSAVVALRKYGHGTIRDSIMHELGEPIELKLAKRGDVLLGTSPEGDAVGICTGELGAFVGHEGLIFIPVKDCLAAWSI